MYIPSYDFRIFDLPQFSPLGAQEFGADTMFSAGTPTGFIAEEIDNVFNDLLFELFIILGAVLVLVVAVELFKIGLHWLRSSDGWKKIGNNTYRKGDKYRIGKHGEPF